MHLQSSPSVERKLLSEQIAEAIRTLVLRGELAPGERLVEKRLADILGVSAMPVREALRELEHRGLVTVASHGRKCVAQMSRSDLVKVYEIRNMLEPYAARCAALRWEPRTGESLRAVLNEMKAHVEQNYNAMQLIELDEQFHRSIWQLAGNDYLYRAMEAIIAPVFLFMFVYGLSCKEVEGWREVIALHEQVLYAITASKPELAAKMMEEHLANALRRCLSVQIEMGRQVAELR